jgi:hypothetical protein
MNNRKPYFSTAVLLATIFFLFVDAYRTRHEITNLKMLGDTESQRSKLLSDELNEIKYDYLMKPTYNEGYRDAIIRMGTPTQPGSYRDGYYAAFLALGNSGYSDGYHAAIAQYGFPKSEVPPTNTENNNEKKSN